MKDPSLKLFTMFIQGHFSLAKVLELTEIDFSGKKNKTDEISLGVGLKIQRSKHFQFHVVHIVGR